MCTNSGAIGLRVVGQRRDEHGSGRVRIRMPLLTMSVAWI